MNKLFKMRFSYKKVNNVYGFICCGIAAIVYFPTIEPTANFWDCGEFIVSAYKLEVGHPPGAPLFLIGSQNWDGHGRSGRYACKDFGQNYLSSSTLTGDGLVIFTNGDDHTFC